MQNADIFLKLNPSSGVEKTEKEIREKMKISNVSVQDTIPLPRHFDGAGLDLCADHEDAEGCFGFRTPTGDGPTEYGIAYFGTNVAFKLVSILLLLYTLCLFANYIFNFS